MLVCLSVCIFVLVCTLFVCVYSCVIKADLQTSSQRLNLSGGSGQPTAAELAPDDSIDDVIHHEVKELGTHMYVVHRKAGSHVYRMQQKTHHNEKCSFSKTPQKHR